MRFIDIFKSEQCGEIFNSINEFSSNYLKDYNDQIESLKLKFDTKDIFDFVWGTIELSESEICIIDSPIIQRLRNIQQMGFASYVYCNADYSRFAHTIGVIEAAGRISKIIDKNIKQSASKSNTKLFDMTEIVRLAAIFHDTGHMFFSHVSENFFTNNKKFPEIDKVTNALTYFNENISIRANLHEMLSVMIVNSDEVKRLFDLLITHSYLKSKISYSDENFDTFIDYISGIIIGTAIDKRSLPYSMIIKGCIDADRLDYLSRDSATTKVPLAVDIARLINKITVVKLDKYQPSKVWIDCAEDQPYQSMAIKYSAQRLIWQLSMARSILYQSIYFHHKKLTAEAMFKKACEKIFAVLPNEKLSFAYIMSLTDQSMGEYFQYVVVPEEFHKEQEFTEAKEIMTRIRDRNLYKRVASFSQDAINPQNHIYESFVTNIIENPFSNFHKTFIDSLTREYFSTMDILKKNHQGGSPVFMFIESNWQNDIVSDIPIDYGNASHRFSSDVFKETPVFGEQNKQKQYYFVTDQNERKYVYIALEKVLFREHQMRIDEGASTCAKFTLEELEKVKDRLFELDYYNDCLELLPDNLFIRQYNNDVFSEVVKKYQNFSGAEKSKVTEDTLINYLKQFLYLNCGKKELGLLLNGILLLLKKAIFIDREFFVRNMASLMGKISRKGYNKKYIVKLGGTFDSANHLFYYFNDIKFDNEKEKETFSFHEQLSAILETADRAGSCIIFFDDGACSGTQVVSIFQELMGVPVERRATGETHGQELSEENKNKLKTFEIVLAYICFNSNSKEYILDELKKLGICNVIIEFEHDLKTKVFDPEAKIFESQEQLDIVQEHLRKIGYEILKSAKTDKDYILDKQWDEKMLQDSSLGYDDAQQIVVLERSIPTYSLTALWQDGKFEGRDWHGLFKRTDKKQMITA